MKLVLLYLSVFYAGYVLISIGIGLWLIVVSKGSVRFLVKTQIDDTNRQLYQRSFRFRSALERLSTKSNSKYDSESLVPEKARVDAAETVGFSF